MEVKMFILLLLTLLNLLTRVPVDVFVRHLRRKCDSRQTVVSKRMRYNVKRFCYTSSKREVEVLKTICYL